MNYFQFLFYVGGTAFVVMIAAFAVYVCWIVWTAMKKKSPI